MKTKVINIKTTHEPHVYIGRSGKSQDGYFGNPHYAGWCNRCKKTHTGEELIEYYKVYFHNRMETDKVFRERVWQLYGKTLGCFCKPDGCHGDVIAEYLNNRGG